ncbi:MAG: hypothetical protein U1D33_03795, partial [bacterium]|nr:hypothetical protein [bacterium]
MKNIFLLYVFVILLFFGCGGTPGGGGGGGGSATLNLTIQNPDPNASGTSKAYKTAVLSEAQPSVAKAAVASASVTCCSVTGSGPGSISENICFTAGAATTSGSIEISFGSNWTLCVECVDSALTTNGIKGGYSGCVTTDIASNTSVSLSPKFLNLIADDADDCQSIRINQDSATQSKLTILFGSLLTDTQKGTAKVLVEFDTAGSRTSLGVLDSSQSD